MADIETNRAMNDDTILLIINFDSNFPNGVRNPPKLLLTKRTFDVFILISVK
jgi:hypothetical protein